VAGRCLLPVLLGWRRAAEVLLTRPWLSAEEAVACGVARRVVPDGALVAEALALAERVAAAPLPALRAIKSTMLAARADAVAAARRREERAFAEVLGLG